MSDNSAIEWTDTTWNPTTGCDRISPGCDVCYAMTLAKRLKAMGSAKYQVDGDPRTSGPGFGLAVHPDSLDAPLHWRKPRKVFVNSMSDLFHDKVPGEFIARVFAVMGLAKQHTFQVLTKRHGRMRSLLSSERFKIWTFAATAEYSKLGCTPLPPWPLPNVWLGVSVENQQWAEIRIPALLNTPAAVRFLSCEPLLGPIDLRQFLHVRPIGENYAMAPMPRGSARACGLATIDWLISGGESGPDARPVSADWLRGLRDQCVEAEIPHLFKQWGGRTPKAGGRELDGRTWDEYPTEVTV